ncbi:MAG: NAD(P)/FAD-dependent oxidoreductase [Betaproteobacteria bacterium]|nr:NAD(P)/FAD-dependent oxidoreductase [Betaproteobacteria bacterium]
MKRILVLGGGFAGLWSAVGAARMLQELGIRPDAIEVMLVDRHAYHNIRVRNYEADLSDVCVPFDDVLMPIDVRRIEADVVRIDCKSQLVHVKANGTERHLAYDRLVFALGSTLHRPALPGLAEYAFDVDTFEAAMRLQINLVDLGNRPVSAARNTVIVVGAGLTGIEVACEMPDRLRNALGEGSALGKVLLLDANASVGADMGEHARPVIDTALQSLGVETKLGVRIGAIDCTGVTLTSGEFIPSCTVVWCAGMRASALTTQLPVKHDAFGRVPVDEFMRVQGIPNVFAAGDAASCRLDGTKPSVMSCQHGRPMGRYAGHNAVADLAGRSMLPLQIDAYVTVLDLGRWGAVYTTGRDRKVLSTGAAAKATKQLINRQRIYPPRSRDPNEILAAAAPVVQNAPAVTKQQ